MIKDRIDTVISDQFHASAIGLNIDLSLTHVDDKHDTVCLVTVIVIEIIGIVFDRFAIGRIRRYHDCIDTIFI